MDSPVTDTFGDQPALDDSTINPHLKSLLLLILQENRVSFKKILEKQEETANRVTCLENFVKSNNGKHLEAFQKIHARLDAVEKDITQSRTDMEIRISQLTTTSHSCLQNRTSQDIINNLVDKVEGLDKASRRNNIVIRGLNLSRDSAKNDISKFLSTKFNYTGSIINTRPIGKEINKTIKSAIVTLESWEAKLAILRNKKVKFDQSTVYIQADLTAKERKTMYELRKFARSIKPKKSITYAYQTVKINGNWYKWDERSNTVVLCNSAQADLQLNSTLLRPPPWLISPHLPAR